MRSSAMPLLLLVLIGSVSFLLFSGQSLPPVVASHFAAGGGADGFTPRNAYLGLMAAISVGIPLLLAICNGLLRFVPPSMVNLPNRDYWLAPERKEETYAFLRNHGIYLAVLKSIPSSLFRTAVVSISAILLSAIFSRMTYRTGAPSTSATRNETATL